MYLDHVPTFLLWSSSLGRSQKAEEEERKKTEIDFGQIQ